MYFDDGSIAQACPPLKALLHIMLHDSGRGKLWTMPEFRKLFTRENLLVVRLVRGAAGGQTKN